jgi:enoyl-CoA hydratase
MRVEVKKYENIKLEQENGIAFLTINRPDVRNALNKEAWEEIGAAINEIKGDDQSRVVIITGEGDSAFVAGSDIRYLLKRSGAETMDPGSQAVLNQIEDLQKPVIAAINGYALGGGLELAMACDIRIASEKAKVGMPEINIGIIPGSGGTQRLTKIVGAGQAKKMIMTGEIIDATEALRIGLVQQVVEPESLTDEVLTIANKMVSKAPLSLRLAKVSTQAAMYGNITEGLMIEKLAQSFLFDTEDKKEGMTAFLEKRKPEYKGR